MGTGREENIQMMPDFSDEEVWYNVFVSRVIFHGSVPKTYVFGVLYSVHVPLKIAMTNLVQIW